MATADRSGLKSARAHLRSQQDSENGMRDIPWLAVGLMNAELSQSNELKFECLRVLGSLDEIKHVGSGGAAWSVARS